jgi:hypothetical protein
MQVEAVLQMLQPGFSVAAIAAKRRNKSNPGTLFRSAVDVLRRTEAPMTVRQIADALIAGKAPQAHPQAGHRPAGRYPVRPQEAQRRDGDWRGRASEMEVGTSLGFAP